MSQLSFLPREPKLGRFRPPKTRKRAAAPLELVADAALACGRPFAKVPASGPWLQLPIRRRKDARA